MSETQRIRKYLRLWGLPALGATPHRASDETGFKLPTNVLGDAKPDGPALRRRPRGIHGKGWTRKDERQYESILNSCVADRPKCTTKYTPGGRVRKCHRDCQRVAAATVNQRRKGEGKNKRKKR